MLEAKILGMETQDQGLCGSLFVWDVEIKVGCVFIGFTCMQSYVCVSVLTL